MSRLGNSGSIDYCANSTELPSPQGPVAETAAPKNESDTASSEWPSNTGLGVTS
jgi:hypothetical protein